MYICLFLKTTALTFVSKMQSIIILIYIGRRNSCSDKNDSKADTHASFNKNAKNNYCLQIILS